VKQKRLFIIDSLTCGGAEKSLVSLLPLLNRGKYEIYLWMRYPEGAFIPLIPKGVHVVEQPKYDLIETLFHKISGLLYSFMIRWNRLIGKKEHLAETEWKCVGWAMKVPEGKWDVVIAYQQGLPTYLVAEKFFDCKKIAWVNADLFKAGYNVEFNSRFYQAFDHICPVSDRLCQIMMENMPIFKDKYTTIWDIINPELIRQLAKEYSITLKTKECESVIVTTGRLSAPKGYDIAVVAAKILKDKGVCFKWYIVGEGAERQCIEKMIKDLELEDYVILLGLQTNPYKFMAQADVYVQTSKFEGFGLTIAEAKILGKPVVSTNFDVVHNQIVHEKNGLIADMDGKSVAENIYRMITDDNLRESIVKVVEKEENTTYITESKKVEEMLDF